MLSFGTRHLSLANGFLQLIDYIALFYLILLLWIPFFWFVFHPVIRFWRRLAGLTELNPKHRLCGVIRTGIYARLRHPRYLLYMLMILSMAFLTGAPTFFLLAFLNILMYQILAPLEERKLLDQYGPQYEDYRRLVPRFVPHLVRTPEARISS